LDWLNPVLAGVAGILSLLASQLKIRLLAYLAAGLMLFVALLGGVSAWRSSHARLALQEYVYKQVESSTRDLLELISQIIVHASDEWLPASEDEFFSLNTATLACWSLNIDRGAPILPERSWISWIDQQTKAAREQYGSVLSAYASSMDEELIRALTSAKTSFFLMWPSLWVTAKDVDRQLGAQRPPLLCPGLESEVEKSLSQLHTLYRVLWSRTRSKPYPFSREDQNAPHAKRTLGQARFSPEDLAQWHRSHPYAPSGKPPQ
jgi:hypothetical protein